MSAYCDHSPFEGEFGEFKLVGKAVACTSAEDSAMIFIVIPLYHYLVLIDGVGIHESVGSAILSKLLVVVLQLALEVVVGFEKLALPLNTPKSTFQGHLNTGQVTMNSSIIHFARTS